MSFYAHALKTSLFWLRTPKAKYVFEVTGTYEKERGKYYFY